MIIVKLKGGLGNQMFQYAAARQLAEKLSVPLKLDIAFLLADAPDRTKREYELDKFEISAELATPSEIEEIKNKNKKNPFRLFHIKERYYKTISPFLQKGKKYYMNGYWQSEKYFDKIESILRKEFVFKDPLTETYFVDLLQKIKTTTSVSIHFRRGDYVTDSKTNRHHGVCSLDYYQKAVEYLSKQFDSLHLFISSDDIFWAKSNFHTDLPMFFVEKNNETQHSDFRLMSMCKHNIIANSSYSWWAAWLNPNEDKIVIAPRQWYMNKRKQLQAADRVPKSWVRI